jgi:hypothetical protein
VRGARTAFTPGDIIVPVTQRDARARIVADDVHRLVDEAVEVDGVRIHAVTTGLTPEGFDLGSRSWPVIRAPQVAILAGPGDNGLGRGSHQVGEAWHLLNHVMGIPASLVDVPVLSSGDLTRYDVMAMTTSFHQLDQPKADRIRQWVESGGLLIISDRAATWAAGQEWIGIGVREVPSIAEEVPYGDVGERQGAQAIGGSIVHAHLDSTHPVAYGLRAEIPLFKGTRQVLEPTGRPGEIVARFAGDPLISGYLSSANEELISDGVAILARKVGRGRVIIFSDNPNFRGFWKGTERLFVNAVLFGRYF